jgi:ankyrin repeat protein
MKEKFNLKQPFLSTLFRISYVAAITFFLESCKHFVPPSKLTIKSDNRSQLVRSSGSITEEEKESIIVNGHTITLYQKEGFLQAIVKEYLPEGFYKIYNVPVYIAEDIDLSQIASLNGKVQNQFVHINIEQGYASYVYIGPINLIEVTDMADNYHDHDNTILYGAAASGNLEMVKVLLTEGLDVNAKDSSNNSLLHFAAINNHLETIILLLQSGIDVNAKNNYGDSALHGPTAYGYKEVVQILLAQGVDVNAKNKEGNAALHVAAAYRQVEIIKILLNAGADIHAKNQDGNSPLHLAVCKCQDRVAEILIERGAKTDTQHKQVSMDTQIATNFNNTVLDKSRNC